jgi:hypothetical protein
MKKRLTDLYVVGKHFVVNDLSGDDPIEIWLQKLNPVDHDACVKAANAARARILVLQQTPECDEVKAIEAELYDMVGMSRELMCDYLVIQRLMEFEEVKAAELASVEEWSKDDYLEGMLDLWEKELKFAWAQDKEHVEAGRVFSEMQRFQALVDESVTTERARLLRDYTDFSEAELWHECRGKAVEMAAQIEWMKEYRRSEVFFATREPNDHRKRYFTSRGEVDDLEPEILGKLLLEYQDLGVGGVSGKE